MQKSHFESPNRGRKSKRQPRRKYIIGQGADSLTSEHSAVSQSRPNVRQPYPPKGTSCKDRSPNPYPFGCGNTCNKSSPMDVSYSLCMDHNTFQIDTVGTHYSQNFQNNAMQVEEAINTEKLIF